MENVFCTLMSEIWIIIIGLMFPCQSCVFAPQIQNEHRKLSGWLPGASFGEKTKGMPPSQPSPAGALGRSVRPSPTRPRLEEPLTTPLCPYIVYLGPSLPSWAIWKPQRVVGTSEEKRIEVKIHYREESCWQCRNRWRRAWGPRSGRT